MLRGVKKLLLCFLLLWSFYFQNAKNKYDVWNTLDWYFRRTNSVLGPILLEDFTLKDELTGFYIVAVDIWNEIVLL